MEKIVDHKVWYGRQQYLIRWLGFGPEEDNWLPEEELENAARVLKTYKSQH